MTQDARWESFQRNFSDFPSLGLSIDLSLAGLESAFPGALQPKLQSAFEKMAALETGAIANPDEQRMVGHYWLRNAALAPKPKLRREIEQTIAAVKSFALRVHGGTVRGAGGEFRRVLVIGIGGSALGPQFVSHALGHPSSDRMTMHFFDNTDPDGMDKVLEAIGGDLGRTLAVVISKSGGTKETRNGMLEAKFAYEQAGLKFEDHAIAITGEGSELDQLAVKAKWIERFPMWDWVGGRTSETSAVGLLPAALQGLDIDAFLQGAAACDELTRKAVYGENPAAQLAAAWFAIGQGRGAKDMVILPYKDRLELFSKYLQQLIMESLGKELDLTGRRVNQGIAVYGNKGSTDQHAYIQQLRDGLDNFFVTFIQVLTDRARPSAEVEPGITTGDYLQGFWLGTRAALAEKGRASISLTITKVDAFHVGVLIALYERAVGLYASLIEVNAYHQPGVEAGKKAATAVLKLQLRVLDTLKGTAGKRFTAPALAAALGAPGETETIFQICRHLAANGRVKSSPGAGALMAEYFV